jgi:N-acyl-D-aspartate/D-glutamate deacylase
MHELLIKNGTIVDGTGAPAFKGDIAIDDGRITAVGQTGPEARETLDATGLLVTPGFVDVHTHFDGQVTWDPLLTPSCWHGVTSVVMGNCGVGFAPVHRGDEQWLIGLMEGVEDIPGTALTAGIQWNWETFPEYLDHLAGKQTAMDFATQVPHGAVRAYVMGERGAANEPAEPDDIEAIARIVKQGMEAGALGVSTSRTLGHRAIDGRPVPGTFAAEDELMALGRALGELGTGVFELAPAGVAGEDLSVPEKEVAWMRRVSAAIGRPITFALLQYNQQPEMWRKLLDLSAQAAEEGAQLRPQVHGRTLGGLMSFQSHHPFERAAAYREVAHLPIAERVERLRDPELRERILDAARLRFPTMGGMVDFPRMFPFGATPDYEPGPDESVSAIAAREGRSELEVCYDLMLEDGGKQILYTGMLNYAYQNLDPVAEMLHHPTSVLGLADSGAHCGLICDASVPTFMLTHWVRDRSRGQRLGLEWTVKKQTLDTATLYGLHDRGVLKPGYRADVNVIDFPNLRLELPKMVYDLPANGRRFIQRAHGYVATYVAGTRTIAHDEDTGARPGKLIRGAQTVA